MLKKMMIARLKAQSSARGRRETEKGRRLGKTGHGTEMAVTTCVRGEVR